MCILTPTSPASSPSTKRSIHFDKNLGSIRTFPKPTKADEEAAWYSDYDYDGFKDSFAYIIFMMDMGKDDLVESDEHTTLGLEKQTEEGSFLRHQNKRLYYDAVLGEQEKQKKIYFTDDPERIRDACEMVTVMPTDQAQRRANENMRDIYGYLQDTREALMIMEMSSDFDVAYSSDDASDCTVDSKEKKLKSLEKLWGKKPSFKADSAVDAKAGRTVARPPRVLKRSSMGFQMCSETVQTETAQNPSYGTTAGDENGLGYGTATPDDLGYGAAAPDDGLGYGTAAPDSEQHAPRRFQKRATMNMIQEQKKAQEATTQARLPLTFNATASLGKNTPERNPSSRMQSKSALAAMSKIAAENRESRRSANNETPVAQPLARVRRRSGIKDAIESSINSVQQQMHRGTLRSKSPGHSGPLRSKSPGHSGPLRSKSPGHSGHSRSGPQRFRSRSPSNKLVSQLNEIQKLSDKDGGTCQRVITSRRPPKRVARTTRGAAAEA